MTWSKFSDTYLDKPEFADVSRSARYLDVEAIIWSNRHLTDGRVPKAMVRRIAWDSLDADADADALLAAGVWIDGGDHYQLDWSDQETADVVEKRRTDGKARKVKFDDRRKRHNAGDHSDCDPSRCHALLALAGGNGEVTRSERVGSAAPPSGKGAKGTRYERDGERVTNAPPDPSRPDPARERVGRRRGEGGGTKPAARSARATRAPGRPAARGDRVDKASSRKVSSGTSTPHAAPAATAAEAAASSGGERHPFIGAPRETCLVCRRRISMGAHVSTSSPVAGAWFLAHPDSPVPDFAALHPIKAHPWREVDPSDSYTCSWCGMPPEVGWHRPIDSSGRWGTEWLAAHPEDDEGRAS